MKEIPFPDGVIPLEIFVGSVGKERTVDTVDGRPGVVDYGFNYTDRPVSLFLRIKAADAADFRLLRNEVFATFDVGSAFYVAEADVPSRVLKVVVDESYIPDRLTEEYADFDINCRTLDSVFWETRYTTLELHDSGYSATAEKYGLVDNIDDEKVKYRFTPQTDYMPNLISLTQAGWEVGSIASTTGGNTSLEGALRTKNYIPVTKGERYYFNDSSAYASAISKINILQYQDGVYLGTQSWHEVNRGGTLLFVPRGNQIKLSLVPMSGFNIHLSFVGHTDNRFRMKLELGERFTGYEPSDQTFVVYNAGNVAVEPESMYINILFWYCTIIDGKMTIKNLTTGDALEINRNDVRRHIRQEGINVTVGGVNRFRDTNKRFISLAPGDNRIEITGAIFDEARINFKFYYK